MKNVIGLVCLSAFIFCAFWNISAQDRKISEAEFTAIQSKSSFKDKSYRKKVASKTYKKADGSLTNFFNETTEYLPSGDMHTVSEWGKSADVVTRTETIVIGQTIYTLHPSGEWRQSVFKTESDSNATRLPAPKSVGETTIERVFKGKVIFRNQNADLYESCFITKINANGVESVMTLITKHWYNSDGQLVKIEQNQDKKEITSQTVWEFEYDPNIKIEAPKK